MGKICDHTSVGQVVWQGGRDLLMIERLNYPQAFALPAGHLDGDSYEDGAKRETKEEVGLEIVDNDCLFHCQVDNPCKRENGTRHNWKIYRAHFWNGEVKAVSDAKRFFWASPERLRELAKRTEYFMGKYGLPFDRVGDLTKAIFGDPQAKKTDPEWVQEMGLEPVWYYLLKKIYYL